MRRMVAASSVIVLVSTLALSSGQAAPAFTIVKTNVSTFTEPNVHVSDQGDIFVDGPEGAPTSHSSLLRSQDGGATFQKMDFGTAFRRTPGGGDSHTVTRGDRVYFIDLWAGSDTFSVSEDRGTTWTYANPVSTLPASDRQWIALGPRDPITGLDTIYALYALIQPPRQVMLARSRTAGLTWEDHIPVPGVGAATGFTGPLRSDGDQRLAFSFTEGSGLYVSTSTDGGTSWTTTTIDGANPPSLFAGIGLDGDDISVSWIDSGDLSVELAVSHDFGATFPIRHTVAEGGTNTMSWTDTRDGKIATVYYNTDEVAGRPDDVSSTALWYAKYVESLDGGATFSAPVTVGSSTDYAKKGVICTGGLGCSLPGGPGGRELGDFFTVAIGPTGASYVAFGGRARGVRVGIQR